jgi:hypothetical protein
METVSHLTGIKSDHCPIILQWQEFASQRRVTEEKIFRYEIMWENHNQFKPFLDDVWQAEGKASNMIQLQAKLTRVLGSLNDWGKNTFGNVRREIRQLCDKLEILRVDPPRLGPSDEQTMVVQRQTKLYQQEEVMWRLRSRV